MSKDSIKTNIVTDREVFGRLGIHNHTKSTPDWLKNGNPSKHTISHVQLLGKSEYIFVINGIEFCTIDIEQDMEYYCVQAEHYIFEFKSTAKEHEIDVDHLSL